MRLFLISAAAISVIVSIALLSSCFSQKAAHGSADDLSEEWEAPARAAENVNPVAADQESIAAGKAIYERECIVCHGIMGKGNGVTIIGQERRPSDLSMPMMWEHSDGALFWKITEGRPPMASFKTLLTDYERWQVVNYIRTLAARPEGSGLKQESKATPPMDHMH